MVPLSEPESKKKGSTFTLVSPKDLIQSAKSENPRESLPATRQLRELCQAEEKRSVIAARQEGIAWETIAELLGRRVSSVWEKYHDLADQRP
jgi:hypothetical protein